MPLEALRKAGKADYYWIYFQEQAAEDEFARDARFTLRRGRLYAFWVSPERSGASHGYVAAGGPGFTGPTDTVGDGTR